MQADDIRQLRKRTKWTQAEAAEALGISTAYLGELERGEKTTITPGLARRIYDVLCTRLDVSYSTALAGWTVSVTRPAEGRPGRVHYVVGKYDTVKEAERRAEDLAQKEAIGARIHIHPREEAETE